ncbi:MAG: hypothetical protein GY841_22465 [FCB group bacterium]|nr:hypothetical protein [FCB group bacterium]
MSIATGLQLIGDAFQGMIKKSEAKRINLLNAKIRSLQKAVDLRDDYIANLTLEIELLEDDIEETCDKWNRACRERDALYKQSIAQKMPAPDIGDDDPYGGDE